MSARPACNCIRSGVPVAFALAVAAVLAAATPAVSLDFAGGHPQGSEAAIVGKAKIKSRTPFQTAASATCGNGYTSCLTQAYVVPKKRRLEVRNVSCTFTVRAPGTIENAGLIFARGQTGVIDTMVPLKIGESGGFQKFAFNADTFVFGEAGYALIVGVSAYNDVSNLNCKVAGELVKLK